MTLEDTVIQTVVPSVITFFLGVLVRKRVGRVLVYTKKWLFNDVLSLDLLATRIYPSVPTKDLNTSILDRVKLQIPGVKLVDIFSDEIVLSVPVFNKLRMKLETVTAKQADSDEVSLGEEIKLTLKPDAPIRLGTREFDKLNHFSSYADHIFNAVESSVFQERTIPISGYVVCDIPRIARFLEQPTFHITDEEHGADVTGNTTKIEIVADPINKLAEATVKYRFS